MEKYSKLVMIVTQNGMHVLSVDDITKKSKTRVKLSRPKTENIPKFD